jgi:hypothetical protein
MRTHRALALTLLSGMLTACGQPGAVPGGGSSDTGWFSPGTMPPVTLGDVAMYATLGSGPPGQETAAATGQRTGLVVEYVLVNNGTTPVLVHDRVPSDLGSAKLPADLNPEHAWVFMANGRIRLSKQGFAPAPGVRFIAAPVIGARLLGPKQRLTGRAWAPLPVELDVPSTEFDAPRTPIDPRATAWDFCVQLTVGGSRGPAPADGSVLEVPAAAPNDGELLCSAQWALPPEASVQGGNPGVAPTPN